MNSINGYKDNLCSWPNYDLCEILTHNINTCNINIVLILQQWGKGHIIFRRFVSSITYFQYLIKFICIERIDDIQAND